MIDTTQSCSLFGSSSELCCGVSQVREPLLPQIQKRLEPCRTCLFRNPWPTTNKKSKQRCLGNNILLNKHSYLFDSESFLLEERAQFILAEFLGHVGNVEQRGRSAKVLSEFVRNDRIPEAMHSFDIGKVLGWALVLLLVLVLRQLDAWHPGEADANLRAGNLKCSLNFKYGDYCVKSGR